MTTMTSSSPSNRFLPSSLQLPETLRQRVCCRVSPNSVVGNCNPSTSSVVPSSPSSFILYLPTVVLRKKHNPGFALACHLANHHNIPVVVLAVVLDDAHLTGQRPIVPITQTARRLSFVLEALQSCTDEWQQHGALTLIRVHGPGKRQAHHLTLAHSATAVVMDEPFVEPWRTMMRRVVKVTTNAGGGRRIPFYTVDGSTTVPPCMKLRPMSSNDNRNKSGRYDWEDGDIHFSGAPAKAWRWEEQTKPLRKQHVYAACRDGALDAPELCCKVPSDILSKSYKYNMDTSWEKTLLDRLPSGWKCNSENDTTYNTTSAPGQRPWSTDELLAITDCKEWVMTCWEGVDITVKPCQQTHGSQAAAIQRWKSFIQSGRLKDYAKLRNRISQPHAVSRISCYLNLGILSIFEVIHDVWHVQGSKAGFATGARKFLDEIIKFREGSYVHCFSTPYYHLESVLPVWSRRHLDAMYKNKSKQQQEHGQKKTGFSFEQLSSASTGDEVWDAMQGYLIETGELHNNARMTWGKTIVHWQGKHMPAHEMIQQLVCLNDRYALDGLSPPSYFGLLWCAGFQDKPTQQQLISTKWASQYRQGSSGFDEAMSKLYATNSSNESDRSVASFVTTKKSRSLLDTTSYTGDNVDMMIKSKKPKMNGSRSQSGSILSYFSKTA